MNDPSPTEPPPLPYQLRSYMHFTDEFDTHNVQTPSTDRPYTHGSSRPSTNKSDSLDVQLDLMLSPSLREAQLRYMAKAEEEQTLKKKYFGGDLGLKLRKSHNLSSAANLITSGSSSGYGRRPSAAASTEPLKLLST